MKVDASAREKIKPSCPTPTHLKTHNLSFLDQVAARFYVPLLLYYDGNKENIDMNTRCNVIKKSLAETLTKFYFLAGKIVNDEIERFVDCNDDGVDFCETKITASGAFLLSVQVNVFEDCGGMVIGLCINHKVADASSITTFVNGWATIVRDRTLVTKKFAFEASKLAELTEKFKFTNETEDVIEGNKPTRVEALSAFLWKCFIDIDQAEFKGVAPTRVYLATHAVNIRSRMVPQFPTCSFGYMIAITDAISSIKNEGSGINERYYPKLAQKVRDAVKKIDR
ncbi:vinorine synthase-like, partial [Papaver somniferum]